MPEQISVSRDGRVVESRSRPCNSGEFKFQTSMVGKEKTMRYLYLSLLIGLTAVVFLFKLQNLDAVTVSFLSARLTLPLSVLLVLVYVLGMFTGGVLLSLVRSWLHGARTSPRLTR